MTASGDAFARAYAGFAATGGRGSARRFVTFVDARAVRLCDGRALARLRGSARHDVTFADARAADVLIIGAGTPGAGLRGAV